ncbi:MAG: RagB/SusD family nutrient uptake outer membrane protein, partial [Bacteroidales bacterium]|nr:RagB/SusD family nutrient uptake outer membrane protein [Bacteroidales bacterium]MDD5314347.1 RagB/SusD family nutrient uptake outer membrane protein [Bacteroidales bacterium]
MKKYIIPILLLTLGLTSCQKLLEIDQKGVISTDSFYQTDDDAESALVAAYEKAMLGIVRHNEYIYSPYNAILTYPADDIYAAGSNYGDNDFLAALNEFRQDINNQCISNMYKGFYSAIYGANLVIDNFEYGTSAVKDRCISEARVIRAFSHMMLAILWGTPPIVDHVLTGADRPGNSESQEAVLRWAAAECIDAAKYLDERQSTGDKAGAVRITKGAAYAFAGKALLFAKDYAAAKTELKKVISSGKYALVPGNRIGENFHVAGDGNEEKVFEFNQVYNSSIGLWSGRIQRSTWMQVQLWNWRADRLGGTPTHLFGGGWGGINPTGAFAEALIANDGFNSYRRKAWIATYDEVLYEMPYTSDKDCPTREDKEKDPYRGIIEPVGLYGHEGYFHLKLIAAASDIKEGMYSDTNFLIMRYAEVLLMYAECCAHTNDNDGLQYLNMVQQRAGSQTVSTSL